MWSGGKVNVPRSVTGTHGIITYVQRGNRDMQWCLMKFPDETSLSKHLSLKKKCQEIYNMGLMDPSIASDMMSSEPDRDVASSVSYYYSRGQKRKKINQNDMSTGDDNDPKTNSFATYHAYPHRPADNVGNIRLGDTLKHNKSHSPKSKFSTSSVKTKQVELDVCHFLDSNEYNQGDVIFPQELQS
jgi:hypothetical protein